MKIQHSILTIVSFTLLATLADVSVVPSFAQSNDGIDAKATERANKRYHCSDYLQIRSYREVLFALKPLL